MSEAVRVLNDRQRAFLAALSQALVPETLTLAPERRARFFEIIDSMLATRPASMRLLIGIFLVFLRWAPLLRFGGRLDRLEPARQRQALRWFEDSPLAAIRTGFWGVKTLVFAGYYAQPEIAAQNGYRPSFSGNEKLRG